MRKVWKGYIAEGFVDKSDERCSLLAKSMFVQFHKLLW
jgi:hypothetical protein